MIKLKELLVRLIEKNRSTANKGQVADYIPALKKADPRDLGICILDMSGNICSGGDYNKKFTMQSISKVIALILALMDNGESIFNKVDMKATDEPFNSLYKLDLPHGVKPANPMINAGAIVTTSLIKGNGEEKFNRLLELLKKITSNKSLKYNDEVFQSEKTTADKNRAIAYLLKNKGLIEEDVEEILDVYFKQCSIEVDCADLAKIGTFLANKGRILETNEKIVDEKIINYALAIMTTCGMYDYSGEYLAHVGIPSKSGVSGGILAVVPNQFGIGVYGPALDEYGNSVAGMELLKDLSNQLNLSLFS
ncbi:glutaminase A [Tepidimicrobium xylanilyticum]|uniref:glutaminase A n=1 Tax=Tepidimicrobium xylanilyticum TaxID=1123352 RepID=UPI00295E6365|nr:glutaminase A [Tepidimicrobium xylanilyticum]